MVKKPGKRLLTQKRKLKVRKVSEKMARVALLNDERAAKHELAGHLATLFTEESLVRVCPPPKRQLG